MNDKSAEAHSKYLASMNLVIDFLEQDSAPVPSEVLAEIAHILRKARQLELEAILGAFTCEQTLPQKDRKVWKQ